MKNATYEITNIKFDETNCGLLDAIAEYGEDALLDYTPDCLEITIAASGDVFSKLKAALDNMLDYPVESFKYKKIG